VIGAGTESHSEYSYQLGKWLAENGFHLINEGKKSWKEKGIQAAKSGKQSFRTESLRSLLNSFLALSRL
jgi:hypothetical protein